MKNYFLLLVIIISFFSGFYLSNIIKNTNDIPLISQKPPTRTVKGANTAIQCSEDLRLDVASKQLGNNKEAIDVIKQKCLWLFGSLTGDLEDTGKKDLVFWGSSAGCGSCHGQTIYVVSGNKVIFKQEEEDPQISIKKLATGEQGLVITSPLFQHGDTYASHTWGLTTTYVYFMGGFVHYDQSPFKY